MAESFVGTEIRNPGGTRTSGNQGIPDYEQNDLLAILGPMEPDIASQ